MSAPCVVATALVLQLVVFFAGAFRFFDRIPLGILVQFGRDRRGNINVADRGKFDCEHHDVSEFVSNIFGMIW